MIRQVAVIAHKEIVDHGREVRSIFASLLYLLMGPLVVLLISLSPAMKAGNGISVMGGMISIFVLVAVFVGGMNMAMDLLAGERERRSLLPLLLTPVSRLNIIVGKWLATCLYSLVGLAITLLTFAAVDRAGSLQKTLFDQRMLLCWVLLGLSPLAVLAAALQVAISTACRTPKEAQTYLSLLIFIPMGVAMFLIFFPERLPGWAAFLPIVGQQAIAQAGITAGKLSVQRAVALALVTVWIAVATVVIAGKLLERDDVVYGS